MTTPPERSNARPSESVVCSGVFGGRSNHDPMWTPRAIALGVPTPFTVELPRSLLRYTPGNARGSSLPQFNLGGPGGSNSSTRRATRWAETPLTPGPL